MLTNITNIHHYIAPNQIKCSVNNLLKNNQNPLIIYSAKIGDYFELRALCVNHLNDGFLKENWNDRYGQFVQLVASYQSVTKNFIVSNSNFFKVKKEVKQGSDFCYLGYVGGEENLKNFFENKQELRLFHFSLCAYDTEHEVEEFVKKFEKNHTKATNAGKLSENYWIITFRGTKEKINPWLRSLGADGFLISLHDQYNSRLQLFSRAIHAVNYDRSIIINKDGVRVLDNRKACA